MPQRMRPITIGSSGLADTAAPSNRPSVSAAKALKARANSIWMRKNPEVICRRGMSSHIRLMPQTRRSANWAIIGRFYAQSFRGAVDQGHRFRPAGWVRFEQSAHRTCHRQTTRLANAADGHASVLSFQNYDDALRVQIGVDQVGDLVGHAFLHLRPMRNLLDHSGQLAQAGNLAARQVADVCLPHEW